MSIYTLNGKRINIHFSYTAPDGTHGIDLTRPENREKYGIEEHPEPQAPEDYSDKLYYRTEQDEAPFVVYTRKSDEQIAQMLQAETNQKALAYLAETDWMMRRHNDELLSGSLPTMNAAELAELLTMRQAARDSIVKVQP